MHHTYRVSLPSVSQTILTEAARITGRKLPVALGRLRYLMKPPQYVSMRSYIGAADLVQLNLIPLNLPAIYYWIVDFAGEPRSADEVERLFRAYAGIRGKRQNIQSLEHLDLFGYVSPEPIKPEKFAELVDLFTVPELQEWASDVLTRIQRPLYVGRTSDLSRRVKEHLDRSNGLNDDFQKRFDISDCALVYFELPDILLDKMNLADPPESAEEDPSFNALETADYLIDNSVLPTEVNVLEYIAIRTGMPVFNQVKPN